MRSIMFCMAFILALYELSKWVMEMAGIPGLEPPEVEYEPKTVADLIGEIPGLPDSVYTVFQRGVELQLGGQSQGALQEYGKLRQIPRSSGETFDLAEKSSTLRHNLRLLLGE